MKVEVENLNGHFKKLTIEVPADVVATRSLEYFRRIQRDVELKGFRKGKAPLEMVRSLYADSAKNDVAREVVERSLSEAIRTHSLSPVNMPEINIEAMSELSGLKYTATFENTPPIDLKDYKSFKGEKASTTVEAKEIDAALDNVRGQMATYEDLPADTTAVTGLVAQIDHDATEAGQAFAPATDKGGFFEIGNGTLTPDFEKNVLGMKAGETKNFTVKFPAAKNEDEATPVSGKTLDFTVKLNALKSKKLPPLDDDFAKKLGPFNSVADLRSRVEEDLKKEKEGRIRRDNLEKAITWLVEKNPVDAPETMVAGQMEQLAVEAGMQLQRMGLDEKAIEERLKGWGNDMNERAVRQVKASLLLSNIAQKESIKASEEDVRQEINRMAVQSRKSPKDVWADLQEKGLVSGLVRQITELKALDFVVDHAAGQG